MSEEHQPEEVRPEPMPGEPAGEGEKETTFNLCLPTLLGFLPRETRGHLRSAQREMLLAARSLLDVAILCLEKPPEEQHRRVTRIEIR